MEFFIKINQFKMSLNQLNQSLNSSEDEKLQKAFQQFQDLLSELNERELPEEVERVINGIVDEVPTASSNKASKKFLCKNRNRVIHFVEKKLKLVPKNHYRNTWLAIGMAVFGIPMGAVFSGIIGNYGLIGLGLPIGMAIGIVLGKGMDKKAFEEGRQLEFTV